MERDYRQSSMLFTAHNRIAIPKSNSSALPADCYQDYSLEARACTCETCALHANSQIIAIHFIVWLHWSCVREERLSPEQKPNRKSPASDTSVGNVAISPAVRRAAQASAMKVDTSATSPVRVRGDSDGQIFLVLAAVLSFS